VTSRPQFIFGASPVQIGCILGASLMICKNLQHLAEMPAITALHGDLLVRAHGANH
jgi:hypothetical protein